LVARNCGRVTWARKDLGGVFFLRLDVVQVSVEEELEMERREGSARGWRRVCISAGGLVLSKSQKVGGEKEMEVGREEGEAELGPSYESLLSEESV
jgi:hypothetical protein